MKVYDMKLFHMVINFSPDDMLAVESRLSIASVCVPWSICSAFLTDDMLLCEAVVDLKLLIDLTEWPVKNDKAFWVLFYVLQICVTWNRPDIKLPSSTNSPATNLDFLTQAYVSINKSINTLWKLLWKLLL